jgi:predicted CXXCH cytochrome family protein
MRRHDSSEVHLVKRRGKAEFFWIAWALIVVAALWFAVRSLGQSTQPSAVLAKPTGPIAPQNCVTSECHSNIKNFKVLHGPVNVNACDACHKLVDPQKHTFDLARDKTQTCTFCHKIETAGMAIVHKPVTQGQCLSCHNPHGGTTNRFLRGKNMTELCATCHKDPVATKKFIHGPAAAGACDSCHAGHASKFPNLLSATGRDLCFTCHTEMKSQMGKVRFTHKAVEQDCMSCHDPHASNFVMQTPQPPAQLCTSCHEHDKIKTAAMESAHKHSVVSADNACLNCHTAHGGDLAHLMRAEPMKVCMKCHEQPQKTSDGRTVLAVAEVLDPKLNKHGPLRDGNCQGCHEPHGSNVVKLLAKPYPEQFYSPFALDKYALCFDCHDKQLVTLKNTTGLTGFRNGDLNLHYLHVNKSDRGRTCRACHDTHAGPHELHVRDSVPYGNWQMPINFRRTETGGGCAPGCHKPYSYDRKSPVPYEPAPPSNTPAPSWPATPTTAPAAISASAAPAAGEVKP